jgi:hypothetical protein
MGGAHLKDSAFATTTSTGTTVPVRPAPRTSATQDSVKGVSCLIQMVLLENAFLQSTVVRKGSLGVRAHQVPLISKM